MQKGRIIKATAGFYYVDTGTEILETKPRGLFRKDGTTPYVGDLVMVDEVTKDHEGEATITEILPRKNYLVRPPVANLDYMIVVVSTQDPAPNFVTLDKLLAILESHDIPALLAVTKIDLSSPDTLLDIYEKAGYSVMVLDYSDQDSLDALTHRMENRLVAFAGNSGVGKSTILNEIDPSLSLAVGETSQKLGRGRHTTRHVEIHTVGNNMQVADTPGFSSLDLMQAGEIYADNLADLFIDFREYVGDCRFRDCHHLKEAGCAVRQALENGHIAQSRYDSYAAIYEEVKDYKEWDRR